MRKFGENQIVENPEKVEKFLREILAEIPENSRALEKMKNNFSAAEKIATIQNRDLIFVAQKRGIFLPENLKKILQKRAVRTISGVSPIAVLTKNFPCPGRCIFCPTEPEMPKSYLSSQPAAARARRNNFDPFLQVKNRLRALEQSGHPTSKLEIIVMGGTFNFLPKNYQTNFIKKIFDAANFFSDEKNFKKSKNIFEAQKKNETAKCRIIGLTLETRPDFVTEKELFRFRKLGATRVEIGVQTIFDEISQKNLRDQKRTDVIFATRLLKNFGFKICYHLMPGLPGSTAKIDEKMMDEIFSNPDFRPDFLKIYPTLVLKFSALEKIWRAGKFAPISDKNFAQFLLKIKKKVPPWMRIMRILRDVPAAEILAGPKISNLRQILRSPEKLKNLVGEKFLRDEKILAEKTEFSRKIATKNLQKLAAKNFENKKIRENLENENFKNEKNLEKFIFKNGEKLATKFFENENLFLQKRENSAAEKKIILENLAKFWRENFKIGKNFDEKKIEKMAEFFKNKKKIDAEKMAEIFKIEKNLAEKILKKLGEKKSEKILWPCRCVRCREIGFKNLAEKNLAARIFRRDYAASGGREIFLSFESADEKILFALLRLRIPEKFEINFFARPLKNAAIIREVHSYGGETDVGKKSGENFQHRGFGQKLIFAAERIARDEFKMKKISVISGVGARKYYEKFGYKICGTFLTKKF